MTGTKNAVCFWNFLSFVKNAISYRFPFEFVFSHDLLPMKSLLIILLSSKIDFTVNEQSFMYFFWLKIFLEKPIRSIISIFFLSQMYENDRVMFEKKKCNASIEKMIWARIFSVEVTIRLHLLKPFGTGTTHLHFFTSLCFYHRILQIVAC